MREIKIAKSAGFCFGVKRAVNLVYDQVGNAKKVYTYGPIIHNEEVVSDLERKGVHVLRKKILMPCLPMTAERTMQKKS